MGPTRNGRLESYQEVAREKCDRQQLVRKGLKQLMGTLKSHLKHVLRPGFMFLRGAARFSLFEKTYETLVFASRASRLRRQLAIRGKRVLIVGSAPSASLKGFSAFDYVIGVHGSPANIRSSFDLETHLVVVDRSLFNAQELDTNFGKRIIAKRGMLRGNPLLKMVVAQSNSLRATVPIKDVADIEASWSISRIERRIILRKATRSKILDSWDHRSLTGTGGFAIALAWFLGATSIQFTGFNLINGTPSEWPSHFYGALYGENLEDLERVTPEAVTAPRTHSSADAVVVASLALRGFDITTNEPDFFPLIQNWLHLDN